MAKNVYLIQHAKQSTKKNNAIWQVDTPLLPGSEERIKSVAQQFKDGGVQFSAFRHSSLVCSRQTCEFLHGFMDSKVQLKLNKKLGPGEVGKWNRLFCTWKQKQPDPENPPTLGPVKCSSLWPDLCEREGERVLQAIEEIADEIKDGESAAAISHNLLICLAQGQACGMVEDLDLLYCQAVRFTFENNQLIGLETIRM